jgi:hypothetical protein
MPVHPDTPNLFNDTIFDGASSFFGGQPPLSQAVGESRCIPSFEPLLAFGTFIQAKKTCVPAGSKHQFLLSQDSGLKHF